MCSTACFWRCDACTAEVACAWYTRAQLAQGHFSRRPPKCRSAVSTRLFSSSIATCPVTRNFHWGSSFHLVLHVGISLERSFRYGPCIRSIRSPLIRPEGCLFGRAASQSNVVALSLEADKVLAARQPLPNRTSLPAYPSASNQFVRWFDDCVDRLKSATSVSCR